jgi:hypothetical protein
MDPTIELSLEKEFSLKSFAAQVLHLTREQAQELLIEQYKQMMLRDVMYQEMLKHEWKLGLDFSAQ